MQSVLRTPALLTPTFGHPDAATRRTVLMASVAMVHVVLVLLLLHGITRPTLSTTSAPLSVALLAGADAPAGAPLDLPPPAKAVLPGAPALPIPALSLEAPAPASPLSAPAATTAFPAAAPAPSAANVEAAAPRPPTPTAVAPTPPPALPAALPKRLDASAVQYLVTPPAEVPRASRRAGESGTVWLRVIVDVNGLPASVILHRSSGHPRLDEQALWAMRQARFTPHREDGRAVEIEVIAPIEYPPG